MIRTEIREAVPKFKQLVCVQKKKSLCPFNNSLIKRVEKFKPKQ